MKILLVIVLMLFVCDVMKSQENAVGDSIASLKIDMKEKELFYTELFNFADESLYGSLIDFNLPIYTQTLMSESNWIIDFSRQNNSIFNSNSKQQLLMVGYNPFYRSSNIMNQARYKINEKFTIGGSSFAASSIFEQIPLNWSYDKMNIKGISLFMQYKISNKVKIETRFNISNNDQILP